MKSKEANTTGTMTFLSFSIYFVIGSAKRQIQGLQHTRSVPTELHPPV